MSIIAVSFLYVASLFGQPYTDAGVVYVVEGVGGWDILGPVAQMTLPKAGVPHEIVKFTWTHGWGKMFKDLQDIRHLLKKANTLAAQVKKYREEHPSRPVYLIGRSGGAAIVLAAAERLPPQSLERIILLSPAVSPMYDLRPALKATRCEIVSFHSAHDRIILDWGTKEFGTADRYYAPSAGCRGFRVPDDMDLIDKQLYARLVQVPWNANMMLEGHFGSHLGSAMPGFIGKEVAPWLKTKPDRQMAQKAR